MLAKCREQQWKVGDIDWSRPPRPMSKGDEIALVQYFTDMVAIERLAGALFLEQVRRVSDPTLRAIFQTFVKDEVRHAHAAQMLADHYDVHHYRSYRISPSLERFYPPFLDAVKYLSDDIANAYITSGELILDIALLRSINDFAKDETSDAAMRLINRDESRHIAIDYHMGRVLRLRRVRRQGGRKVERAARRGALRHGGRSPTSCIERSRSSATSSSRRWSGSIRQGAASAKRSAASSSSAPNRARSAARSGQFLQTIQDVYMRPDGAPLSRPRAVAPSRRRAVAHRADERRSGARSRAALRLVRSARGRSARGEVLLVTSASEPSSV